MSSPDREQQKKETWTRVAGQIATLSTCQFTHVGAVLVSHEWVCISTGYNGTPHGIKHCSDCIFASRDDHREFEQAHEIHAEMNALIQATSKNQSLKDAKCFSNISPCPICMKHLAQAGVTEIYFSEVYWRSTLEDTILSAEEVGINTVELIEV